MIAKVKVASFDLWCKENHGERTEVYERIAGMEVSIDTESVTDKGSPCGGKGWLLTVESTSKIAALYGDGAVRRPQVRFCEHMLEVD